MFKCICILFIAAVVCSLPQQAIAVEPASGKPIPYGVFVKILEKGDVAKLDALVSQGYDLNKPLEKDDTVDEEIRDLTSWPIVDAVEANNFPIIKYLIKHDVNLNVENDTHIAFFIRPISSAIQKNNITLFKLLVESGASLTWPNKYAKGYLTDGCLCALVEYKNIEILKYALNHNAIPNASFCEGDSCTHPLAIAAKQNSLDIFKLLVKYGGDVNYQAPYGQTSLITAIANENIEIVKYIMNNGGDPNKCGTEGSDPVNRSPLTYAKETGDKDIIAELMKYNPKEECPKEENNDEQRH